MWGGDWTSESDCTSADQAEDYDTVLNFQSGKVEVGSKDDDGDDSMRVEVAFNKPFAGIPVVFLCPEGEPGGEYSDVFGACVIEESVSEEGFHANVARFSKRDTTGWGQEISLNWLAVDSNSPLLQASVHDVGTKRTGNDEEESVEVQVRFPQPFPRGCKPAVFATCYCGDKEDAFSVCVQYSATKKATLNVCRSNGYGWKQDLRVAVLATTLFPCCNYDVGPSEGEDKVLPFTELTHPGGNDLKRKPMLFTVAVHQQGSRYNDSFVCSPANVGTENFQINLLRNNLEEDGWGQNLRLQAIMIP